VVFTPGHTPGSISVLTQANEMIVGDLLMGGYLGGWFLPTRPGLHYFADDLDRLQVSVHRLLELAPRLVHPGHGGPLDLEAISRRFS
jgi:glyoxylase-like metal-dependent hydrolase (beta-lactamase superfamily II)